MEKLKTIVSITEQIMKKWRRKLFGLIDETFCEIEELLSQKRLYV